MEIGTCCIVQFTKIHKMCHQEEPWCMKNLNYLLIFILLTNGYMSPLHYKTT